MKKQVTDIINIDNSLAIPVYKQIVQSIHRCIENGVLSQNDMLPSVNSISETFSMARGSVFTAYNDLRASGIIDSVPGKGYFIASTRVNQKKKILLLFRECSCFETSVYNNLFNSLPEDCSVDIALHHSDIELFEAIINEQADRYNVFIIVPHIHNKTLSILSLLDNKQVLLLDSGYKEYRKNFRGIFRNPEKTISDILTYFKERTGDYKRIVLVSPDSLQGKEWAAGFNKFCKKNDIKAAVLGQDEITKIKKGDGVIVIEDKDLVDIINHANASGHKTGKDIGIVSCSENILKKVIQNGITTAETDFNILTQTILSTIFSGTREITESPVFITDRGSF